MALNVTPHIPQVVVNAASPSTESLARNNAMKEVVPAPTKVEAAVPQKTREQEAKAEPSGNVVYDKNIKANSKIIPDDPQQERSEQDAQQGSEQQNQPQDQSESIDPTSAGNVNPTNDENSGPVSGSAQPETSNDPQGDSDERSEGQDAQKRQQEQQARELERVEIQQLERRDTEVRNHEMAHATVGGAYAGTPRYDYETGPNGKKYAVSGEVSIDVSKEATPEQTIRKMNTVRAAALAPAEPSSQDLKVAAEATKQIAEARVEMLQETQSQREKIAATLAKKYDAAAFDPEPKSPSFSAVA